MPCTLKPPTQGAQALKTPLNPVAFSKGAHKDGEGGSPAATARVCASRLEHGVLVDFAQR